MTVMGEGLEHTTQAASWIPGSPLPLLRHNPGGLN
jgi:hypothetical protein